MVTVPAFPTGDVSKSVPWQGADYRRSSAHHRAADEWFLRRYSPGERDTVVDLGCGTGEFTARLATIARFGRVTGVDADASMLEQAREHTAPGLSFVQAAAQDLDEVIPRESVDVIVSRAMLHWISAEEHPRVYAAVFRSLRPGGVFHLEAAGPGNVRGVIELLAKLAVRHGLPPLPAFPDPGRALDLLDATGFEIDEQSVRTVAMRRSFTREQLEGFLRTQALVGLTRHADPALAQILVADAIDEIEQLRRHDGTWDQTFVRLELFVRRPL